MRPLSARLWAGVAGAVAPFLPVLLAVRARRGREDASRVAERYGHGGGPRPSGRLIWLHAASVGESLSALPLLAALPDGISVLFTTGTRTSATLLAQRLPGMGLGARVIHRFVPLDVPRWAERFLDHWRPEVACFVESELWPNLLAACRARAIPTALINARLSARSQASWGRLPGLAREMLGGFSLVAAQSEEDAARLRALGARDVLCVGNLKFAAPPLPADEAMLADLSAQLGDRPRWLAASLHSGDDEAVLRAHAILAARYPDLLTAIVPRHPARGVALAARTGAARRSLAPAAPPGGVWIADTLGELGVLYRCFPIVFMGKSFGGSQSEGGQNPWEPACLGCAVASGPATQNFAEAVRRLAAAGALTVVRDAESLAEWVGGLLADPGGRRAMGQAALATTASASAVPALLAARVMALMGGGD